MPQYPVKGRNEEIPETTKPTKEGVIELTQSFYFNSSIWPVLKPSGKCGMTDIIGGLMNSPLNFQDNYQT